MLRACQRPRGAVSARNGLKIDPPTRRWLTRQHRTTPGWARETRRGTDEPSSEAPIDSASWPAFAAVIVLASSRRRPSRVGSAHRAARPDPRELQVGGDSWQLFKATNASRGRFDVPSLVLNRELSVIARRHSLAMARSGTLFHTSNVGVYLHGIDVAHLGRERGLHAAGRRIAAAGVHGQPAPPREHPEPRASATWPSAPSASAARSG